MGTERERTRNGGREGGRGGYRQKEKRICFQRAKERKMGRLRQKERIGHLCVFVCVCVCVCLCM